MIFFFKEFFTLDEVYLYLIVRFCEYNDLRLCVIHMLMKFDFESNWKELRNFLCILMLRTVLFLFFIPAFSLLCNNFRKKILKLKCFH